MIYSFQSGSLLYCRSCQCLRPHKEHDTTYIGCVTCGRLIHVVEVVATYSADEYENPAPIILPLRLRPGWAQTTEHPPRSSTTPVGGDYEMTELDWATLRGEVKWEEIEAIP